MNLRIARAFWMAHATRTWMFLLTGLLLGAIVAFSYYFLYSDELDNAGDFLTGMLIFALPIPLLGMLYNATFSESFSCELPESTLLLPVSSFAIAFHRFAFNLMAIAGTVLLFYGLTCLLFAEPSAPWWQWLRTVVGLCAVLQLVALATSPTGDWTMGFLIAAAWIYLAAPRPWFVGVPIWPLYIAVTIASFLAMWAIVHLIRQGRWQIPMRTTHTASRTTLQPVRDLKPFKSAWHAQLWFETVRYWRPISRIFLVLSGWYLLLVFINAGTEQNYGPMRVEADSLDVQLFIFGYFAFAASVFGGVVVSLQNRRMQIGPMAAFLYVRPFSTPQLAAVRVFAALRVWAIFAVVAFIWACLTISNASEPQSRLEVANLFIVLLPGIAWLWAGLWTWNLFALLLLYGLAIPIVLPFAMNAVMDSGDRYLMIAFPSLIITSVLLAFVLAWKRRLIHPKLLWSALPAVLVTTLVWVCLFASLGGNLDLNTSSSAWFLLSVGAAFAFIVAPVATVPLAHHWSRHR